MHAVVREKDNRAILAELGKLGSVQLICMGPGPETAPLAPRNQSIQIVKCDRMRTRIDELRRVLEIASRAGLPGPAMTDMDQAEEILRSMEEETNHLLSLRRSLVDQQNRLTAIREQIAGYCGFGAPLGGPDQFSFLHFITGTIPKESFEQLRQETGSNVVLVSAAGQKGSRNIIAITNHKGFPALENTLQKFGFKSETLPTIQGTTIDTVCEENSQEQKKIGEELEKVNAELRELAIRFAPSLDTIEKLLVMEHRLLEAEQYFPRTEETVLLTGWTPADKATILEEHLKKTAGSICAISTTYPVNTDGENPPVFLRHSPFLRPFEMLISSYGLPNYKELEPTLFVAISYLVMFGMMFGDVGHGAVLAVFGLIAIIAGRKRNVRDAGILLLYGGLVSIIFGIVYGSFFGLEFFKKYALWHDPLEGDPMRLMYGAVGIGIVMISLGLLLNTVNRFLRGDVMGGFLDKFGLAGLVFYWGALAILIGGTAIRSRGFMSWAVILFLVVPMIAWAIKEPAEYVLKHGSSGDESMHTGGLAGTIMESLVGVFEAILSYLANTISFVRLAAYAMSHAAILVAAFMLAGEVKHFSPGGTALGIAVIILGNAAAILLEGIIASVQALRLEYYEFFGKFFSGDGKAFEPFILDETTRPGNHERISSV